MKASLVVLSFLMAGMGVASAKTIDLPGQNLQLTLPDSWTSSAPQGGALFSASDSEHTSTASLFGLPNDRQDGLDEPEFLNGIKEGFAKKIQDQGMAVNLTKEGPTSLNGVPFYCFQGTFGAAGAQPTTFFTYVTAANNQIYLLSLQSLKPNANAELQGIAQSLTFQTPPILPDPNRPKDASGRFGYLIGEALGVALVLILFGRFVKRAFSRKPKAT